MKKLLLFLTVFLFFGFVTAEEVQVYKDGSMILIGERWTEHESEAEKEPEAEVEKPEPEKEPEVEKQEEVEPESPLENKAKEVKSFFIQPMVSAGVFAGGYDDIVYGVIGTNVDFAFHLAGTSQGHNIYLGFNFGAKYSHSLYRTVEIPVQSKLAFDFKTNSPYGTPEYASLWLALGLCAGRYDYAYIISIDPDEEVDPEWGLNVSWGIGTDLTFANGIVLQFAVKSFAGILPIPSFGFGYRF